jgi:hypothetical protein
MPALERSKCGQLRASDAQVANKTDFEVCGAGYKDCLKNAKNITCVAA